MKLIFDIEADNLLDKATKIHCIVCKDMLTGKQHIFHDEVDERADIEQADAIVHGVRFLSEADVIVGHNIISYDIPTIQKFYPRFKPKKVIDTLTLSRLFYPDRQNGHSLESWAPNFSKQKVQNEDWSVLTPEILKRCQSDVEINLDLYNKLIKDIELYPRWKQPAILELKVAQLMHEQAIHGWYFNKERAIELINELVIKTSQLDLEIDSLLPLNCHKVTVVNKPFKKDGTYSVQCIKQFDAWTKMYYEAIKHPRLTAQYRAELELIVKGAFTAIEFRKPSLSSPAQLKKLLYSLGWEPTTWNYKKEGKRIIKDKDKNPIKTSPKLTEDSYDSLPPGLGQNIAMRLKMQHRLHQLEGLVSNTREDHRIPSEVNSCGTNTSRMRHHIVTNIPKATPEVYLGKEMRELFTCDKGRVLVGCDCSNMEWRITAHYLNNPILTKMVIEQDIHQYINESLGLNDRNKAKGLGYAILYGASVARVAKLLNVSFNEASEIRQALIDAIPGLSQFLINVEDACKKKYLNGLDGRKIFIRSKHSALNALIQCAGAIIEKTAILVLSEQVKKEGLDAFQVGVFHDEHIYDCSEDCADRVAFLSEQSIIESARLLNLRVPIIGEAKKGLTWADIH